jgi:DNA helicase-2/ATP-dependent DNA helicase PcrA
MSQKLNGPQLEAVHQMRGPLLVLAGAGSGKTRVLTHRIVHMIESGEAMPGEILSLTFTNKAAKVMKDRVSALLSQKGIPADDLWISTFHSMGAKLLRMYGGRIGIESGFTIYDDSDQLVLIKECMEVLGLSDKVVSPKAVLYKIGQLKNEGVDPLEFKATSGQFFESKIVPVVHMYEQSLKRNNAVDFGDLIFKTFKLFRDDAGFRDMFNERYRFVLVDEYQDTNAAQYNLLRLMTEKYRNLCVVGDEDQSIYGWRGADIRNILEFERDYPEGKTIKLEENYRSTGYILRAANKVISRNTQRKEKNLFTSGEDGDPVEVHYVENDFEEARLALRYIQQLQNEGVPLSEMAIFYRTNAQSRSFEDRLRFERIHYKIFGGVKFYERGEVKDALSYLRLFVNVKDEVALQRIVNVPARGIGKTTIEQLKQFAVREKLPLFEAMGLVAKGESDLGNASKKKLAVFIDLYAKLSVKISEMSPYEFYALILDETGYLKMLEAENTIEAEARLENLKELGSVISEYELRNQDASLSGFLEEVALINDTEKDKDDSNFVSLMTIHSAKGAEYDVVFLGGLEEELFPHVKPDVYGESDKNALEEERRLCYVGITRARKRLFILSAKTRRVFGVQQMRMPSRFLDELPQEEIKSHDHAPRVTRSQFWKRESASEDGFDSNFGADHSTGDWESTAPARGSSSFLRQASTLPKDSYTIGAEVRHPDYGEGTIVAREGQNEGLKVTVRFGKVGPKKFVVRFAPLEVLP